MDTQIRQPLLILGTYMLAEELADQIADSPGYRLAGFIENYDRARCREPMDGLPVYWVDEIAPLAATHWAICGIGTIQRAGFIAQVAAHGIPFATLVHPTSRVSPRSTLGAGTVIGPGAQIASHTTLGAQIHVNRGALIGHHTTIGAYATIGPGANIAGACRIGEGASVGMGAIVQDHIEIGAYAVIGAGAVVTKNVPAHVLATGMPARVIKSGVEGR